MVPFCGWQKMAEKSRFQTLAQLVAEGCKLREAAQRAEVPERTAYRVAKSDSFRRLVKRYRSRLWRAVAHQLVAACQQAISTLQRIAGDDAKPASAQVSAAGRLLESALRFREAADVERRLTELEAKVSDATVH
jgi:hypothetical protein